MASSWNLVTWNVNSVTARLERVRDFLQREQPDVLCLQELKCVDEKFPTEALSTFGYHIATLGQKTYNGVAVLSKQPLEVVEKGLDPTDPQARFLVVRTYDTLVSSVYVPNGQAVGSDKYAYKLGWLEKLSAHLRQTYSPKEPFVLAGDFNIAPEDRDVHDPELWRGKILCSDAERAHLTELCSFGLHDTYRKHVQEGQKFSWWDYRMLAFPKNQGLRIDFVLASEPLYERCTGAEILRDERKGKLPSDHAPVRATFTP